MFQGRWKEVVPDGLVADADEPAWSNDDASTSFVYPREEGLITVVLRDKLLKALSRYFAEDCERERLALLTGSVTMVSGGYRVSVRGMVAVQGAEASSVRVTMASGDWPAVWRQEHAMRDMMIGWAHSHPGHSIFLSATDLQTQALWFREAWSLALVFDPISGEYGVFAGPDGQRLTPVAAAAQP